MRCAFIFSSVLMAALGAAGQIQVFDSGIWADIRVAAQKTNGQITAAGIGDSWHSWNWNENWQPTYGGSPWNSWGSGDTAAGKPAVMDEMADGTVVSLWDSKDDHSVFALVHNRDFGAESVLTGLPGPASGTRIFLDSRKNFWIAESGSNICVAPPPARGHGYRRSPELVHTITTDELWPGGIQASRLPVSMIEDSLGRIWFWSNCLLDNGMHGAIHGALIAEGGSITNHVHLDGVEDGHISVIASMDDSNLWVAVRDVGIYSVNPKTLTGAHVAGPGHGAFGVVQNIFTAHGDRYVIAGAPWECLTNGLRSVLWRERGGHWTRLVDGLDGYDYPVLPAQRSWRETKNGLWLTSFGLGGWFVPFDDAPAQAINWQKNSPFDSIDKWFQPADGRMLGLQFGRGGILADELLLAQKPAIPPTASILPVAQPPVRTADGRVFTVLRGDEFNLSEWDGKQWRRHPLPDKLQLWGDCTMNGDSLGRLWLTEARYNPDPTRIPAFIFDPATGRFQKFQNLHSALQTEVMAHPDLRLDAGRGLSVAFSRDGRICFNGDRQGHVEYFDGHKWHSWNRINEIMTGEYLQSGLDNPPFFEPDGRLSIVLNHRVWQYDDLAGWKNTDANPDEADPGMPDKIKTTVSSGLPFAESTVAGDGGICWAVADHQLYRTGGGRHVACFAPGEPQPFADGRQLIGAYNDRYGSTFLKTSGQAREEYILIAPQIPSPASSVKVLQNDVDGVRLQLAADLPAPAFSWQVDGGGWSDISTNRTLDLEDLTTGHHKIQVMAFDDRLRGAFAPAELSLDSRFNPAQAVPRWIAQLGDRDFSRCEAAVKKLSRHAALALPALRAAREHEKDSDRLWWLDAAIQQCQ